MPGVGCLSAIQLEFTNGFKTPFYETEGSKEAEPPIKPKNLYVDPERTIREISMMVTGSSPTSLRFIRGLRLIDEKGEFIVDYKWCASNLEGDWTTHKVPEHHRIIGLKCRNTKGAYDLMFRVGFQIWKPNPRAID